MSAQALWLLSPVLAMAELYSIKNQPQIKIFCTGFMILDPRQKLYNIVVLLLPNLPQFWPKDSEDGISDTLDHHFTMPWSILNYSCLLIPEENRKKTFI